MAVQGIGIRELRAHVAALVRRAEAGERIVVTVGGRPVAQLAPLGDPATPSLADLVAAGLAAAPTRPDRPAAPDPVDMPVDVRAERLLDELRGR
jgi:prevent-host-death family protein